MEENGKVPGLPGTLYLCATPIGNLEDMTYRAVRMLGEVELIAAEDTRHTRQLLTHFDIHTRLTSYHEHNKLEKGPELIDYLLAGHDHRGNPGPHPGHAGFRRSGGPVGHPGHQGGQAQHRRRG